MKILLISTRIEGFLVSFLFLFIAVARIVDVLLHPSSRLEFDFDVYGFFAISFIAAIAYVLSWRHEGLGGLVLTLCGILLSAIDDWHIGIPFFIVGQLYVLYWFLINKKSENRIEKAP